jgi:HPt (histidine-containing phosphotransfer) domain-containing protein
MDLCISGVNTEKGLTYYGNELDIYLPLLRSYISNTQQSIEKLREVTPETLNRYMISIHGLKGSSASIGAETTREAASNLEKMARAGDFDGVMANNESFIKDTEIIVANIKKWLDDYDAKNKKPLLEAPNPEALERLKQGCENFNMKIIDTAMSELDSADYKQGADFVAWLREKIIVSEFSGIAEKISNYNKGIATWPVNQKK